LKESLITLAKDALGSVRDLLPIVLVISTFQLFVFREPATGLISIATGALLVVAGLAFFIFGLRLALFPIGETLAHALAQKGSVFWLVVFAFLLGFGTTIAEPALIAIAAEAAQIAANAGAIATSDEAKSSYALGLRLTVALAVGAALVLGVMRILAGWSLPFLIIAGYCLVVLLTTIAPKEIVGIAYDSGGVTTSTVTVPLVTALGVGLAGSIKGRNPMTDGFGLIAFASLTPILFVLAFGIVLRWI
jgi:MFS family permease